MYYSKKLQQFYMLTVELFIQLITPAVLQVATRSKAKKDGWAEQDAVRLQTQQWVEEANVRRAAEIPERKNRLWIWQI